VSDPDDSADIGRAHPSRARALPRLALLTLILVGGAAGAPQEPPARPLDLVLLRSIELLDETVRAGRTEIPLPARRVGVIPDPAGSPHPWVRVMLAGPGAESAVRLQGGILEGRGRFATARLPLDRVVALSESPGVRFVEASTLNHTHLDTSRVMIRADQVHSGYGLKGAGVLVAVFDTGIDFRHDDFRNSDGSTRIRELWDQTDNSGSPPTEFGYGSAWTEAQLNTEIDSGSGAVTEQDTTGHGTHVAGIAAGNGRATGNDQPAGRFVGIAPEADLLVIKGGDDSFGSTDIINGIYYAQARADDWGERVVVNLSLGGHQGPHDGTSLYEQAIDGAADDGVAVVVSAGNEGNDALHGRRTLSMVAPSDSLSFAVGSYTPEDGTENDYVDFDLWYDGSARIQVTVIGPTGAIYGPWDTGSNPNPLAGADGTVDIYFPSTLDSRNDDREALLEVYDGTNGITPATGTWKIHLQFLEGSTTDVDLWIFDDTIGAAFTGENSDYSVGMPGTARKAITVGAWVTKKSWTAVDNHNYAYSSDPTVGEIAAFSSRGPTRDGRQKPEIIAPGQGIFSALSADMTAPADPYIALTGVHRVSQGTSQAAPHVSGAVALMLQADPTLSVDRIRGDLILSARPDPVYAPAAGLPSTTWGWGKLDVLGAVNAVLAPRDSVAPVITVGLLRNSVLTDYLDLLLVPGELLAAEPEVDVSGTVISLESVPAGIRPIYAGDFKIPASGEYTVTVQAHDPAGNDTTITRLFSASLFEGSASGAGVLATPDGRLILQVPAGALIGRGYRLAATADIPLPGEDRARIPAGDGQARSPVWSLQPHSERLARPALITLFWRDDELAGSDPATLVVARWEGSEWVPLESLADPRRNRVEARTDRLGLFRLQAGTGNAPAWAWGLEPNRPNPFNGSTQVRFTLAQAAEVNLSVLNVRGQRVRSLAAGSFAAGPHTVGWDGRGEDGRELASGVYLILLEVEGRVFTRKALLLR
jgi:subtilisin family serine protease